MIKYTYEIQEEAEDGEFWVIDIVNFDNGQYLIEQRLLLEGAASVDEAIKYYVELNGWDTFYDYYLIDSWNIDKGRIDK